VPHLLHVDPHEPDPTVLGQAVAILANGGIVAYPTDTVYGLAVDPRNGSAIDRLYRAKARDPGVAVPLIAGSFEQAFAAATFTDADVRLAREFWPGPLSIVLPASRVISAQLLGPGATVALRVPAQTVARALALAFGCAITATSANVSGATPASTADAAASTLGDRIDGIVDGGPAPGGAPSTIVQLTHEGPRLVRPGAIAWERVLKFVG
jgi:L-threonylcarbamoyladenylate synthase